MTSNAGARLAAIFVSILIPTHRRATSLARTLHSIEAQDFARENYEVIVVSNFEDRATRKVVGQFAHLHLKYFEANRAGVNASRNTALSHAQGKICLFLDDDCRMSSPTYLRHLCEMHSRNPNLTAIGGTYVPTRAGVVETAYHTVASGWMNPPKEGARRTWRLVGGNVSYKREKLNEFRFDESILFGGAETELHTRLELAGHEAELRADLPVDHDCRVTLLGLCSKALYQGMTAGRFPHPRITAGERIETGSTVRFIAFLLLVYAHFFALGREYGRARPHASTGRFSFDLGLFVVARTAKSFVPSQPVRTLMPKLNDMGKALYWSLFKFITRPYWWLYHVTCILLGLAKRVALEIYWRGFGAFNAFVLLSKKTYWWSYGNVHRMVLAAKRIYWRCYGLSLSLGWKIRGAASFLYWRAHDVWCFTKRLASFIFWRAHDAWCVTKRLASFIYWRIHDLRCFSQRLASFIYWRAHDLAMWPVRLTKMIYWRAYGIASRAYWWTHRQFGNSVTAAKRFYWWLYDKRCRLVGATKAFAIRKFWELYSWHWKYRGPLQGKLIHWRGRMRVLRSGLLFARFYISHFQLEGSKTSRFLHHLWKLRAPTLTAPSVLLPAREAEFRDLAMQARSFGFNSLTCLDDVLQLPRSLIERVLSDGFELEILCRPSRLNETRSLACAQEFVRLGARLTPFFDNDEARPLPTFAWIDVVPTHLAIASDLSIDALKKIEALRSRLQVRLLYVDLFETESSMRAESGPRLKPTYDLACQIATRHIAINSWDTAQIYQPFHLHPLSRTRLMKGQVVWENAPPSREPEWTIVIPCYEHFDYLPLVISHALGQEYDRSALEIIAVDDGSSQPAHQALERELERFAATSAHLKIVRLERQCPETGERDTTFRAGLARNAGIFHSRGRKLLFLDSDIVMKSDHLQRLDEALKTADVVQSVRQMLKAEASSPLTQANLVSENDTYPEDTYWENFKRLRDWNNQSAPWKYVCTYALALKRERLRELKLFRPEFCEYGFEDTELGFRLFRMGCRFSLLQSPVFHLFPVQRSFELHFDESQRFRALCQTAQLFYRMHCDPSIYYELRSFMEAQSRAPATARALANEGLAT